LSRKGKIRFAAAFAQKAARLPPSRLISRLNADILCRQAALLLGGGDCRAALLQ
jgi:hypothetical protein